MTKKLFIGLCVGLMAVASAIATAVDLEREVEFRISSQALGPAILEFSDQAGIQIVTAGNDLVNVVTEGVSGRRIDRALEELLKGMGLKFAVLDEHTVSIKGGGQAAVGEPTDMAQETPPADAKGSAREGQKEEASMLDEVVVTAQKRTEKLMEVPLSIGVMSGDQLETLECLKVQT